MSDKAIPEIRPKLGAWAGLLLVAEMACEAAGATLSWKTKSVSGDPDDEYLSLMASGARGQEGRALMALLDELEVLSDRIDPKTGRMRVRPDGHIELALKRELEDGAVLGARIRQSLREKYGRPGMPQMLARLDRPWPSEEEDLQVIAADDKRRLEDLEAAATETIGDRERAIKWLKAPNGALNGRSPLQALDEGALAEVYRVLGRIDHGIFE